MIGINGWDDVMKLQYIWQGVLRPPFCRCLEQAKESYSVAKQALLKCCEPPAKKDMYAVKFQCQKNLRSIQNQQEN